MPALLRYTETGARNIFSTTLASRHVAGLVGMLLNRRGGAYHRALPVAIHGTPQIACVNLYKILCVEEDTLKQRIRQRAGTKGVQATGLLGKLVYA